ncbi:hypothetical protein ADIARSV_0150 [Arcticibacter svalbardensis MN12-7]|uniref:Uncharacterized protein n=1 Tax=Arcticibacter svalbardensis MN12-7 TaxID=1150600 RepID=R9GY48_9SPHI|nr:hypothetical protein [Arcticibacter svalbardensis]EOR96727.1 hypothetical protein ADIARSV_0150 [Arcticibacter svalbardensis MN12-7]
MTIQQNKTDLIKTLLSLIDGSIAPDDLRPKTLTICIGYLKDNVYLINQKEVSEEVFDLQSNRQPAEQHSISYGKFTKQFNN